MPRSLYPKKEFDCILKKLFRKIPCGTVYVLSKSLWKAAAKEAVHGPQETASISLTVTPAG